MANRFLTPPKLTFPVDASAEFNGTSDYIEVNNLNDYSDYDGLTFSTWMYSGDFDTPATIASNWGSLANSDYGWLIFSGAFLNYRVSFLQSANGTTYNRLDNGTDLNENQWYYVTCVWESGSAKIYIDGSLDGSDNSGVPTVLKGTDYPTLIGADADGVGGAIIRHFNGNLANVAIWNRALTSDEINSVMWKTYEQVSTTEKSGLQAWYKLSADEVLSDDSTATLTTYANANGLTFEAPACVQTALNGLPDITDARLYSANYDIRVSADGGNVESLSCVETELNAIL
jgi:hypothetical protein